MAWSRLQSKSNVTGDAVLTNTATYTTNLTSGTKLLCIIATDYNQATTVTSVKDGALNAFTQVAVVTLSDSSGQVLVYVLDTPAGDVGTTPTITVTLPGSFGCAVLIQEVSGLLAGNTTACLDGTAATNTGTATPATAGAYSSTVANEYLLAVVGDSGHAQTYTLTGYTADAQNPTPSTSADLAVGYTNSANGSETMSWASGTAVWGTLLVAFKLSGGAAVVPRAFPASVPPGMGSPLAFRFLPPGVVALPPVATSRKIDWETDYGSGLDDILTIRVSSSDAGSGTEALTLTVTLADSGSGAESHGLTATSAGSDTGSGAEVAGLAMSLADSGTGTESQSLAASLASSDTGSGAETLGIGITLADTGSGADAHGLAATSAGSDAGSGAESLSLRIPVADSGLGSESQGVSASLPGSDSGSGTELWSTSGPKLAADSATGTEAGAVLALVSSQDSGTDDEFGVVNPPPLSVMATQGGSTFQGLGMQVKVLRNVALTQNGASAAATATGNVTITTTTSGSVVYGALSSGSSGIGNAEPGSGFVAYFQDGANSEWYAAFKTVSATASPGPVLTGGTAGDVFSDVAALELLPAGTITEDASSPPYIGDGLHTYVTTAVFSPPVGSYLVALVGSDGPANGSSSTTMTVTDSYGLAWTEAARASSPSSCYAGVWVARVTTTSPAQADSGSGAEGTAVIAVASSDTGQGAEQAVVLSALVDDGLGDDEGLVLARVADSDTGAGQDDGAPAHASADAGVGIDDQGRFHDTDTGTGAEGPVIAGVSGADAATGRELQWELPPGFYLIFGYDTGVCQEGDIKGVDDGDFGSGTDQEFACAADRELASGADDGAVFIAYGVPSDSDSGSGDDQHAVNATKPGSDSATGTDNSGLRPLAQSDSASGADAQSPLEVFPFPPPWLFLPGGGMRLKPTGLVQVIWRPGTPEERVLREWPEFRPSQVKWAEEILRSSSISFPSGADAASAVDGQWPTATVRQYAAAPGMSQSSGGPLVACVVEALEEALL